jgi:chromosome segregation ATPase
MTVKRKVAPAASSPAQKSPTRSPPGKRAKMSPEETAVDSLMNTFTSEFAHILPSHVVSMVVASKDCLLPSVEDRHPLESQFAAVIGTALQEVGTILSQKLADVTTERDGAAENLKKLEADVESAVELKATADAEVAAAGEAETAAQAALTEAQEALATQEAEEADLTPKKERMEAEKEVLEEALTIARGPEPGKKESAKVTKTLKDVGGPDALVLGLAAAIGKEGQLEQIFISQACTLIGTKLDTLKAELSAFDETVKTMATKTETMTATVTTLSAALEEKQTEEKAAKDKMKACATAIKEAQKAQKAGVKVVEKAEDAVTTAAAAAKKSIDADDTFKSLLSRSTKVEAEPEQPEQPAEAEAEMEMADPFATQLEVEA